MLKRFVPDLTLEAEDLSDAPFALWLQEVAQQIVDRRTIRQTEQIMREIREREGCTTREAVRLTAQRLGESESSVWRALRELRQIPRNSRLTAKEPKDRNHS